MSTAVFKVIWNKSKPENIWNYSGEHQFEIILQTKWKRYRELAEAATRGILWRKVFLKISQNSQENTCTRDSVLIKLQDSGLQIY